MAAVRLTGSIHLVLVAIIVLLSHNGLHMEKGVSILLWWMYKGSKTLDVQGQQNTEQHHEHKIIPV